MGWVTSFERKTGDIKVQPTQFVAYVKSSTPRGGSPILQIDTYGSGERENPGKQSQTFQLGRDAAAQLFTILKETYGF